MLKIYKASKYLHELMYIKHDMQNDFYIKEKCGSIKVATCGNGSARNIQNNTFGKYVTMIYLNPDLIKLSEFKQGILL